METTDVISAVWIQTFHVIVREEGAGRQAVESTGGVPPWGSGANRPPLEDDGPVKKLLR